MPSSLKPGERKRERASDPWKRERHTPPAVPNGGNIPHAYDPKASSHRTDGEGGGSATRLFLIDSSQTRVREMLSGGPPT